MKAALNEFTKEYWRGDDRDTATDYAMRLPLTRYSAPIRYTGRINGQRTDDQVALRTFVAQILEEVFAAK